MDSSCPCPLCGFEEVGDFHRDKHRIYLRCCRCALVFVPTAWHLDAAAEKAVYDLHENDLADPGYRTFLSRLADPLLERLGDQAAQGLDFGCGPVPVLAQMLEAAGHSVSLYDPFYRPEPEALRGRYDFIVATEVVEHLAAPGAELDALWQMLRPGGVLGVMTKLVLDQAAFRQWHYIRDPTHISFFSRDTLDWWAACAAATVEYCAADVTLLFKPD